ncbi:hypothetical protein [Posidoniimonas polymericola]|nr:hypothetical protein [Posidoniimonas polymericola]
MPSQSLQQHSARRIWIDMAVLQVSILWLAGWAPRTPLLLSLSAMTGVVYLLWSWNLTGPRRHRNARILLGLSVIAPVLPLLVDPTFAFPMALVQSPLLVVAGYCAMKTNHIVTASGPRAAWSQRS